VEKDFHPSVQGQGPRKGAKGSKGSSGQQDEAILAVLYISSGAIIPGREPRFYLNKIITVLVFPWGFFQGYLPRKLRVLMCLVSSFASIDLFI